MMLENHKRASSDSVSALGLTRAKTSTMKKRWELQSWDAQNERWITEAEWADGNALNGVARKDMAMKEAKELAAFGVMTRVIDKRGSQSTRVVARFRCCPTV